jgi:hypothetical protein
VSGAWLLRPGVTLVLPSCLQYEVCWLRKCAVPASLNSHKEIQTSTADLFHCVTRVAGAPFAAEDSGSELIDKLGQLLAERPYDEFDLVDKLREKGWVLPAYSLAPNAK